MKGIQEFRAFLEQNGRTQFDHEEGINPAILKTSYRWFNDPVRVKLMDTIHAAL